MAPRVSVVVPARNEAPFIQRCVTSIRAQALPDDAALEVIVVDGGSTDGTGELAEAAGATVISNPDRTTPAALNRGLAAAHGDVLLRFDAHSEMRPGYIEACLRALSEEPGAVNVGGWCDVRGLGPWGDAVAAALRSRFGVGNPRLWRRPSGHGRKEVETVPFGCFPTSVLRSAGGWRPDLLRNQDFELNHRLRAAGGRIVYDPGISFVYRPRESLGALWNQYWQFGQWKAIVLSDAPSSLRPRQLAPLGLLLAGAASFSGGRAGRAARGALGVYLAAVVSVAAQSRNWRTAPVLVTIHSAWALGFVTRMSRLLRRRARGSLR
ncbi:MAG TPA: glycosyltransferase family 2 protein [Gaiellaceae bacterium]|nr:glycosyltransferase family 2 protein [Gaiellaceae bacterium]